MSDFSLLYEIGTLKESLSTMKIRALQAEIECDKWKAEAEVKTELYNAEYETTLRYMRERDELRKRVELLEFFLCELRDSTPYIPYIEQITNILNESHAIGDNK